MEHPTTREEAKRTGAKYYFTGTPCKHGHVALRKTKGACVECIKVEWKAAIPKRKEYFKSAPAVLAAKRRYYEKNRDLVIARAQARPSEKKRRYGKNWKVAHPERHATDVFQYKRRNRIATPKWLSKEHKLEIRKVYLAAQELSRITGVRYSVDHIVPLRSEEVCGLHVPWNLQILPHEENSRKGNKLTSP